jgi:hypothetical protein
MAYGSVHIPAGCTVKIGDTVGGLASLGVLKGDASIEITYDKVKVQGSKAETLVDFIKNMVANATFEMYQLNLTNIQKLLDGAATVSHVDGTMVEDHDQTIASGAYEFNEFIECEYQNADGTVPQIDATGVPTLSGATDGALTEGDDFFITKNGAGKWGIIIVEDGTTVTTMDQVFTLSYDYTPAESYSLKMGASSEELTAKIVEFSKTIDAKVFRARLWSVTNENGLTLAFPDSAGDEPASIPITLTGGLDTDKASGEQLIEVYDEIGLTA